MTNWQTESRAIQRDKARRLRRSQWRKRSYRCLAVCMAAYASLAGWWLWQQGELERANEAASMQLKQWVVSSGLTVKKVRISGQETLSPAAVLAQAEVPADTLIMTLPLKAIQQRLLAHPQIADADVTRTLPDKLHIAIIERSPVAIWQHDGVHHAIDVQGVVLKNAQPAANLPIMTGKGAPNASASFWQIIDAAPALRGRIRAAQWIGERRWTVWLNSGAKVLLPMDSPEIAWAQLAEWHAQHGLLDKAVRQIDLRIADKAYVQLDSEESPDHNPTHGLLTARYSGAI